MACTSPLPPLLPVCLPLRSIAHVPHALLFFLFRVPSTHQACEWLAASPFLSTARLPNTWPFRRSYPVAQPSGIKCPPARVTKQAMAASPTLTAAGETFPPVAPRQ